MKKLIYGSLLLASLTATGSALAGAHYKDYKDMPPAQNPTWTGFYVGLNGGYGWGNQSIDESGSTNFGADSLAIAIKNHVIPSSFAGNPSGWLGSGAEFGYDYQVNDLAVVGLMADFDSTNITASKTVTTHVPPYVVFTTSGNQKLKYLGTIRAIVGLTPSEYPFLLYLTGGFGYGRTELSGSISNPGCVHFCGSNSSSTNNSGWVAGAGFQYEFLADWSAKAEYLYYDLGSQSQKIFDPKFAGSFLGQTVSYKGNIVRLAVDYKFA